MTLGTALLIIAVGAAIYFSPRLQRFCAWTLGIAAVIGAVGAAGYGIHYSYKEHTRKVAEQNQTRYARQVQRHLDTLNAKFQIERFCWMNDDNAETVAYGSCGIREHQFKPNHAWWKKYDHNTGRNVCLPHAWTLGNWEPSAARIACWLNEAPDQAACMDKLLDNKE